MTVGLKEQILEDIKAAMRAQEKDRLTTLRLITAALKQKEIDERVVLSDEQVLAILSKMIKQRRDSITQYQAGRRPDLADKEAAEIDLIQHYLPNQLSETETSALILEAIKEAGANSARDLGKVMAIIKSKAQGKVDMTIVSAKVKEHLN